MQRALCNRGPCSSVSCGRSRCSSAVGASPGVPRSCAVTATCSLKKESKRLAKTVKTHRKRLERLLERIEDPAVPALVAELQQLNQTLADLKAAAARQQASDSRPQLTEAVLAAFGAPTAGMRSHNAADSDCSSSDSSCSGGSAAGAPLLSSPVVASMALLASSPAAAGTSSSRAAGEASSLPPPPCIDGDEMLLDQLAPPQEYAASGRVLVCQGSKCVAKGALGVLQAVSHATSQAPNVDVLPCKCLGKCSRGAAMRIKTANGSVALYTQVTPQQVASHVHHHFSEQQQQPQQQPAPPQQQQPSGC